MWCWLEWQISLLMPCIWDDFHWLSKLVWRMATSVQREEVMLFWVRLWNQNKNPNCKLKGTSGWSVIRKTGWMSFDNYFLWRKHLNNCIPDAVLVLTDWNSGEQYQKSSSLKTIVWVKCQHCHSTSHINVASSLHTTVLFKCSVRFICYFQIITSKREK